MSRGRSSSSTDRQNALDVLRRDWAPGPLVLLAMLLFAPRLEIPDRYVLDEVYYAYTAGQYAAGNADAYLWNTTPPKPGVAYVWNHPPLGVLIIEAGILLWGDVPFGWRFSSAVFGSIGILLVYLLAKAMLRDRQTALLAASLVLVDTLWFVQSRIAMLDIFGAVFSLATLLSLYGFLTTTNDRAGPALARMGLFLGLALATKWNAVFLAACIGVVALYCCWTAARSALQASSAEARTARTLLFVWLPVSLFVIPVLVYLAAYIPFFATGHDWGQLVELLKQTIWYHLDLKEVHTYQSSWWQWPLALRPVWYSVTYVGDSVAHVYANGNALLYWAFVPAVVALCLRLWRRAKPALAVLLIGFFGQWLPWALSPRNAFMYYFITAAPLGAIAVSAEALAIYRRGGVWRWLVLAYLAALVAYFVYFYPIHAAVPISRDAFEARMWLPSWR